MGKILLLCVAVLGFGLGWFCCIFSNGVDIPVGAAVLYSGGQVLLPSDRVEQSRVHVFPDGVVIDVENVRWAEYGGDSMEPVLGVGANGLELVPESEADVHVGDIAAYEPNWSDGLIAHRVVGIRSDDEGTYYVLKGDNAALADPGRVRFSQIRYVLIGVIY